MKTALYQLDLDTIKRFDLGMMEIAFKNKGQEVDHQKILGCDNFLGSFLEAYHDHLDAEHTLFLICDLMQKGKSSVKLRLEVDQWFEFDIEVTGVLAKNSDQFEWDREGVPEFYSTG
ncbi:MAG: hypothetical protein JJ979_02500 [Roseibium sp.]|nr:hypothetical protein [Roseibium sp.]